MSNVFDFKGEKIHIKFPSTKFKKYLSKVNALSIDDLSFEQTRKLFLLTIDDFRLGKLSLDDMSEIAQKLWKLTLKDDSESMKELREVLNNATELNFYVRRISELESNGKWFINFMTDLMKFYDKNRKILDQYHYLD